MKAKWDIDVNEKYVAIRKEVDAATAVFGATDKGGKWAAKAKSAYVEWSKDHRNAYLLYKASSYLGVYRNLDPVFFQDKDNKERLDILNLGWSYIRNVPQSYEYVRRGYLYNAGDEHHHKYGDLPQRLLKHDPNDKSVIIAMALNYQAINKNIEYENLMFSSLEKLSTSKKWKPWDWYYWGMALRLQGWKYRNKAIYNKAIAVLEKGVKATPKGYNNTWLRNYIEDTRKERDKEEYRKVGRVPED